MQRFQGQRFQYQQVESSASKIGSFFTHGALLSEYDMSRAKVPLNIENTPLDLTSSFSCLCAAWMYVANRTNSEIGPWQMGGEILGGSSATLT